MAQLWNDYIAGDPFAPSLWGEGDGVYILRIWEEEPPPPELAIAIGEWLYNVRSALDYIIWAPLRMSRVCSRRLTKGRRSTRFMTRRLPGTRISTA